VPIFHNGREFLTDEDGNVLTLEDGSRLYELREAGGETLLTVYTREHAHVMGFSIR
jgi:hypothetical protein